VSLPLILSAKSDDQRPGKAFFSGHFSSRNIKTTHEHFTKDAALSLTCLLRIARVFQKSVEDDLEQDSNLQLNLEVKGIDKSYYDEIARKIYLPYLSDGIDPAY
jgi:hypothetical protein